MEGAHTHPPRSKGRRAHRHVHIALAAEQALAPYAAALPPPSGWWAATFGHLFSQRDDAHHARLEALLEGKELPEEHDATEL